MFYITEECPLPLIKCRWQLLNCKDSHFLTSRKSLFMICWAFHKIHSQLHNSPANSYSICKLSSNLYKATLLKVSSYRNIKTQTPSVKANQFLAPTGAQGVTLAVRLCLCSASLSRVSSQRALRDKSEHYNQSHTAQSEPISTSSCMP